MGTQPDVSDETAGRSRPGRWLDRRRLQGRRCVPRRASVARSMPDATGLGCTTCSHDV